MMKMEDVEAAEPEYRILTGYDENTRGRRPETYYRCGYQVEGAKPVMVDEFVRLGERAEKRAREAASEAQAQLRKMGAPSEVFWWTQKWRTETTDMYDNPYLEVAG